ncbi:hypothetical protein DUZ99_04155 [Xylanibacillus composti]|uniref:Peptidase C39 n=2 Tax=Xylanibacillus composti TaxID=1572762 RepID=A0A8J4H2A8_9BACL|nr:hypothetical protein [Xylanibacillus composti]GIQ68305.1 peptidase C39 [Xylanibacillus composti]
MLIAGLMFTSAVFTVLVYGKITGQIGYGETPVHAHEQPVQAAGGADPEEIEEDTANQEPDEQPLPAKAMLDAPHVLQYPELPRGCEITSLTMLLQYKGLDVDKMELLEHMPRDDTPIRWGEDGSIAFWGNPHTGFVGDITLNGSGFGMYHSSLYVLAKQYVPSTVDLTGKPFEDLLAYVAAGTPVVVWTTVHYDEPTSWMSWESPIGPVRTTVQEHAVLLVGYDEEHVYVNDPLKKQKSLKVKKDGFIRSWKALGKQALSYTTDEFK